MEEQNKKLYLFNPFNIRKATEKELEKLYQDLYKTMINECNTMYEYSYNIELFANLNYIIGEIIARLKKDVIELKTVIEIDKAINTTEERKRWNTEKYGKAPALDYFKALATRMCSEDIEKLAKKEESLERYKNAYKTIEEKINALKKRSDAIKYEEFNE